tara:strand:- start:20093 stop:21127 length:1035 start_codon:yes stop_codon:yes gene_type:complete
MSGQYNKMEYRKKFYPIGEDLYRYLEIYSRVTKLPISYSDLLNYKEVIQLKSNGKKTLWNAVTYRPTEMIEITDGLVRLYQIINGNDIRIKHLYVGSIDFCSYGNSKPFRVKIINEINDNYDYLYIKRVDASRVYGLELEDIFSPNKINYLIDKETIVEEHVIGIPGDQFIEEYEGGINNIDFVRLSKEFVKFNERCFVRLLGDMRSYNYVIVVTQDFDKIQYRIRAMDFDQQSFEGKKNIYFPQFFKDNFFFVEQVKCHISQKTAEQYMSEERGLMRKRLLNEKNKFSDLIGVMKNDEISEKENINLLKTELAIYYSDSAFNKAKSMADILVLNISNRLEIDI